MFNKIYEKVKEYIKHNFIFLISIFLIIFIFNYEFPYLIYKPGGTIMLSDRVSIDRDYEEEGSFNMSYVTAIKGTAPFILLSYILPDWDVIPLKEITSTDNYDEIMEIGKQYLNEGIDNAIIAAFKVSPYNIEITNEIDKVAYISEHAKTNIKIGDEIIKIDDKIVENFSDIKNYISVQDENHLVKIEVLNNKKMYSRYAYTYKDVDNTIKIGIAFNTTYQYKTEIPVQIKMNNNESGSSGGLMMSLAVYNALTDEDITHGRKIVGTGSITSEGKVEEIGGVKYKIITAEKSKADIFLCPKENLEEALKVKKDRNLKIEIVAVGSLVEAIDYLKY